MVMRKRKSEGVLYFAIDLRYSQAHNPGHKNVMDQNSNTRIMFRHRINIEMEKK